mmetsp:Transcript_32443/g.69997  ORF Transcript_32443/g.69997 Transcript_32443/m.69997 type:complete len:277 (-) Transcript_32443:1753-2583(-)
MQAQRRERVAPLVRRQANPNQIFAALPRNHELAVARARDSCLLRRQIEVPTQDVRDRTAPVALEARDAPDRQRGVRVQGDYTGSFASLVRPVHCRGHLKGHFALEFPPGGAVPPGDAVHGVDPQVARGALEEVDGIAGSPQVLRLLRRIVQMHSSKFVLAAVLASILLVLRNLFHNPLAAPRLDLSFGFGAIRRTCARPRSGNFRCRWPTLGPGLVLPLHPPQPREQKLGIARTRVADVRVLVQEARVEELGGVLGRHNFRHVPPSGRSVQINERD